MFEDLDDSKEGRRKFNMSNNDAQNDEALVSASPNYSESVPLHNSDEEEETRLLDEDLQNFRCTSEIFRVLTCVLR